jgi:hypothetical protein
MLGLNLFAGKRERDQNTTLAPVTDQTPPRDTETLIHRQAQQIIHLRAALREIEAMPYRSRKAQDVARRGLQYRPGDYFKARAAERVKETSNA